MALRLPNPAKLLSVLAAFGVALGIFVLLNGSPPSGGGEPSAKPDARSYAALAAKDLQKVRETGDPSYYSKASGLIARALRMDPRDPDALVGAGTLALARHDFRAGLRYGMHAHRVAPELVASYPVIVDAQVELGRYGAAERTLQRMVDLKPNLAAYARASYFRELHGDLPGALAAMRLAVSAGGAEGENAAYVQTLAGNLQLQLGRVAAARASYGGALQRFDGYVPARAGLARVDVARGRLAAAIRRYRVVVDRLPLPEYVIGLSE